MSLTPSQKPTREWLLLVAAFVLIAAICVPLWVWSGQSEIQSGFFEKFRSPERLGRLFLGPEQIACYICACWAGFIVASRYAEVLRQRRAFHQDLLPIDEGARILPEDARPMLRKIDQTTARRGPSILATMARLALGKFAVNHSAADAGEIVRSQADVEQGRLVTSIATVQYLAWAIPAIGFLGTVRGLAGGMSMAAIGDESTQQFLNQATGQLTIAFDCTFVALALSLVVMYFLHTIQRAEEMLVLDCQQFCQEHLVLRLYDPSPETVSSFEG
jgi:biopolymer transport protein ExbB/TolQ